MELLKRITSPCPPYIHLVVGSQKELERFFALVNKQKNSQTVVKLIDGNRCQTASDVFEEFATILEFPDYFGHNWAALDECLNDLSWLPGHAYILFIKDFDKVLKDFSQDRKIFVDIIIRTTLAWAKGQHYGALTRKPTPFHIILHAPKHEKEILALVEDQVHNLIGS